MKPIRWVVLMMIVVLGLSGTARAGGLCFDAAGEHYRVSPWLLWAIAKAESDFDPAAFHWNRNGSFDVGIMQINSVWADRLGSTWWHIDDPCTNIMTGAWILHRCIKQYGYTWQAVGCYHSRTPERRDAYAVKIATILKPFMRKR